MNLRVLLLTSLPLLALGFLDLPDASSAPEEPAKETPTATPQPTLPSQLSFDLEEDKIVNDLVISAVRKGNSLELESGTPPYSFFYFVAVPPRGMDTKVKTLYPGQEFVIHDRHGSIKYEVLDFQKDGLVVNYRSHFNLMSFGETKPRIKEMSFIIRFKEPKPKSKTKKKK